MERATGSCGSTGLVNHPEVICNAAIIAIQSQTKKTKKMPVPSPDERRGQNKKDPCFE
jgi:hypothetical protein